MLKFFIFFMGCCSWVWAEPFKVALILDKGGKDDKSFNSSAFRGATEAKQKLGIVLKEVEAMDDHFFEPAMRSFINKKFDLIIAIGVAQAETVKKLAVQFPQQKFAVIDAKVNAPNVASLVFGEHEGSYIVGYIAGLKSKTQQVGFLGGMDIPLIRRFEKAYVEGVKKANPNAKVVINYVGVTSEAWNNPTKAKELCQHQYQNQVDVIFSPAGASNSGCFDIAAQMKKFAIGVDSNQNWMKPGTILTSMLKRIDQAVFQEIALAQNHQFKAGVKEFGLANQGVDWALDQYNQSLFSSDDLKKINAIKTAIVNHKILVTDYYER